MAQKMTLTAYRAQSGTKAKALTTGEADLIGIPHPLQCGWPRKYGGKEIEEGMVDQLLAHADAARQVVEEKARRSEFSPRAGVPVPAGEQLPLAPLPNRQAPSA